MSNEIILTDGVALTEDVVLRLPSLIELPLQESITLDLNADNESINTRGGTVDSWPDDSGEGNTVTVGTTSKEPPHTIGDATFNGHDSVGPSDANDYLLKSGATNISPTTNGLSIVAVVSSSSVSSSSEIIATCKTFMGSATSWTINMRSGSAAPRFNLRNSANTAFFTVDWTADIRDGNAHILSAYYDDANDEIGIRVDGAAWQTVAATSHRGDSDLVVMAFDDTNLPMGGELSRLLVWNTKLSDEQFDQADTALADWIP